MFTADPVRGGIEYKANGIIEIPETPGLGAMIDESFLKEGEKIFIK
jgi:Na+-translocating ferredoxin:NAD+ oxidoreductase RnfG subunit